MLVLFNVFVASDAVRGEGLLWLLLVFFIVVVIAVLHTAAAADSDDNDNDDRANRPSYSVLIFYITFFAAALSQWDSSHEKFGSLSAATELRYPTYGAC